MMKIYSYNFLRTNYFSKGHSRSLIVKKNIIGSLVIKGLSTIFSFMIVPIALGYVDKVEYGIWLTVSSIIHWFGFFDIGLGSGLRNRLAQAIAIKDNKLGKELVSTTYAILILISFSLLIISHFLSYFINFAAVFNTSSSYANELRSVVQIVFAFFFTRFVLQIITSVLLAHQRSAVSSLYELLNSVFALTLIYILTKTTKSSLLLLALVYSASPVLILSVFTAILYSTKLKSFSPSFNYINMHHAKGLLKLGILFFINRINGIILFTTDNIIITQISGPENVTPYSLTHRYFSILTMFFEIFTVPMWTAFTDAFTKGDIHWIKNVMNKYKIFWMLSVLLLIFMFVVGDIVFHFWLNDRVEYSYSLAFLMACSTGIITYLNIYSRFLNGVSKIKLSTVYSVAQATINIPLSIYFAKVLDLGTHGVILATIFCLLPPLISHPIQVKKIINGTATGLWNK